MRFFRRVGISKSPRSAATLCSAEFNWPSPSLVKDFLSAWWASNGAFHANRGQSSETKNDRRESNVTMLISLIDGCALSGLHSQPLMLLSRNKQPKTGITKRRCRITSPKITILRGGTHEELDRNTFSRGFGRHFGRPGSGRERSRMGIPDSRHGRQ